MNVNCIVVDDEPLAISLLENHISKIDNLKLIATAKSAIEAHNILRTQDVDLMFLDIQMPNLNGIEFVKSLSKKPQVIFTTAFREFALDGFELEAVDYLLKPITFERFFKSVDRVLRNVKKEDEEDFLIFKSEGFNRKVLLKDIQYFESLGNDIKIVLNDGEMKASKLPISQLATSLQNKGFIRVHRSFVVNSGFVTGINNNEVLLEKIRIPVGRSFQKEFESFTKLFLEKRLF